jgi:hypothetical protein
MSQKRFAPTKAAAWNRGPYEIDLPSGNKMLANRPNIYVWHKTGQIPDDVWATLLATAKGEDVSVEARWDAVNWQICKCSVNPEISLAPREGAVCVDDIDDLDRQALLIELGIGLG